MMPIGKRKIAFSFSVNWLITIPLFAGGLIVGFWFIPTDMRPLFVFAAAVVAGSAGLITALNALESREGSADRERKLTSLSFQREWNNPQFYHARSTGSAVMKYFKAHPHISEQKQYIDEGNDRQSRLFDVLNLFESLAIALECGLADETIAKRFFRSLVLLYWNTAEQWVKAIRAERDNARLYQELAWLFNRWKD